MNIDSALIIDDDVQRRQRLCDILAFMGLARCETRAAGGDVAAGVVPGQAGICLVGECGGPQARAGVVGALRQRDAQLPVFVLGGDPPDEASQARVLGRLTEPLQYAQLHDALGRAHAMRQATAPGRPRSPGNFRALVGNSRAIAEVRAAIARVAPGDAPVLIVGESGTGKEIAARHIHYRSTRRDGPFVHLNCGAVPPGRVETEVFGDTGRYARARGGTLFLDGIGDAPPQMQSRLLQVIGEDDGRPARRAASVRLVTAARQDPGAAVDAGRFDADLYYRINVFPLAMPALRDRADDIPLLVRELIERMEHAGTGSVRLTPLATVVLCMYPWPGNVRELANLVERLAIVHPGRVVDLHELPEPYRGPASAAAAPAQLGDLAGDAWLGSPRLPRDGLDLREHLFGQERELIQQALDQTNGVVTHAARLLRMRRTTLVERLRRHGQGSFGEGGPLTRH